MRLDNHSEELSPGRLFIHGQFNDPMTGGPLYCRLLSFDAAWVEYEPIHHREDGSERLGSPRRLPIEGFLEETFGGWYEGTWPPPAIVRARTGLPVPMDPRKIGGRPPAHDAGDGPITRTQRPPGRLLSAHRPQASARLGSRCAALSTTMRLRR